MNVLFLSGANKSAMIAAFEELRSVSKGRGKVQNYIIQEVIGKGAFGTVFPSAEGRIGEPLRHEGTAY